MTIPIYFFIIVVLLSIIIGFFISEWSLKKRRLLHNRIRRLTRPEPFTKTFYSRPHYRTVISFANNNLVKYITDLRTLYDRATRYHKSLLVFEVPSGAFFRNGILPGIEFDIDKAIGELLEPYYKEHPEESVFTGGMPNVPK